jgi:hypothetical protein
MTRHGVKVNRLFPKVLQVQTGKIEGGKMENSGSVHPWCVVNAQKTIDHENRSFHCDDALPDNACDGAEWG